MKKKLSFCFLLTLFILSNGILIHSVDAKDPLFTIHFLINENVDSRIAFTESVIEELSKLNIECIKHIEGWPEIDSRSLWYPFIDYEYIPPYEQDGYDCIVYGTVWDFDSTMYDFFFNIPFLPYLNIYQYNNSDFYSTLDLFRYEQNQTQGIIYANQLQTYLYNDLPIISFYHNQTLMAVRDEVSGINYNLLLEGAQRAENWENSDDQIIKIATSEFRDEYNIFSVSPLWPFNDYRSLFWMQPIYSGLFQRNPTALYWEPVIANDYSISPDKLTITVDLDPNAKFSDGSPILAEDVKFTYQLHMSPEVNSDMYSVLTWPFHGNDSIEVVDSDTVKFTFSSVFNFPHAFLSCGILDKSYVEPAILMHGYSIFNDIPLTANVDNALVKSCGPFMLDTFNVTTETIKLIPNPYWRNLTVSGGNDAKLKELYLQCIPDIDEALTELIADGVDLIEPHRDFDYGGVHYNSFSNITYLNSLDGISGVKVDQRVHHTMDMNLLHPIFGTGELTPEGTPEAGLYLRKAISHAIPRQQIIDELFGGLGTPAITIVPELFQRGDSSLSPYEYDLDIARDYLKQAGYKVKRASLSGISLILILGLFSLSVIRVRRRKQK